MRTIILIACASKKLSIKSIAKDLYVSPLFRLSLDYAYSLKPDKIFILSALHHLLDLEKVLEPYDVTLSIVPRAKRKPGLKVLNAAEKIEWGIKVVGMLKEHTDLQHDMFIILAGNEYLKPIASNIRNLDNRLSGLSQGRRLKYLKQHIQ